MRIEVVLLLYNRPEHSQAVLDSLVQNGVEHVKAFMDHSDEPQVLEKQDRLLETIGSRPEIRVDVHRHSRRLGLAGSVRFALGTALEDADATIVLEDDCVVRPGGIEFFREGLTVFRDDPRIRSVCGYLFPCPFIRGDSEPIMLRRFCSWGWATWRDRWRGHEPDLRRVVNVLAERKIRVEEFAGDLAELCRAPDYLANNVDVWSIPWALEHYATDTFAVYPSHSLIDNIGFDGTGQHCLPSADFVTTGRAEAKPWDWSSVVHVAENEEILKRFMNEHGTKIYPRS